MIYVIECGAEFEVTGDKKKGPVARHQLVSVSRCRVWRVVDAGLAAAASGVAHVRLRAPGLKQCLWNCCLEGMGYGGYSASEIVETFRVYTAERVQAVWRARNGEGAKWARVENCSGDGIWRS